MSGCSAALVFPESCSLLVVPAGFSLLGRAAVFSGAGAGAGADAALALVSALAGEAESGAGATARLVTGFGFVVGLRAASVGLEAGLLGSTLGSVGASALRLAEALVFFVVVGFFAIAAHLRDLIFECRAWSASVRDTPRTCRPFNRLLLRAPGLVPPPLMASV